MECEHGRWDVWEDGNRAPVETDQDRETIPEKIDNKSPGRYASCSDCGKEYYGA
jgi:hypothetical protein